MFFYLPVRDDAARRMRVRGGAGGQERAWTGKSRQAGMNKLGTRLYLVPLPMMET